MMRGNRSADTRPETRLRSLLHRRGLRFRKDFRVATPGRAVRVDIAFTRLRLAVFVDGCYWHGCPEHYRAPRGNASYWSAKIGRNAERDLETNELLGRAGWAVLRIWEHVPLDEAADRIEGAVSVPFVGF